MRSRSWSSTDSLLTFLGVKAITTVLVPLVQGVVACNLLGSKMAGHPKTSPSSRLLRSGQGHCPFGDWTHTWPPWNTSGVAVCNRDLVPSQHHSGELMLRQHPTDEPT